MNRIRNIGIGAGIALLFVVVFLVLSVVTKKPQKAFDFSAGTQHGQVISLTDNFGKTPTVVIFIDPKVEGSTELLSRLIKSVSGVDIIALSVSSLPESEQKSMLSEDILALDKLCFETSEAIEKYNIGNAPVTYFIDSEGFVQSVFIGALKDSSITKSLDKIK